MSIIQKTLQLLNRPLVKRLSPFYPLLIYVCLIAAVMLATLTVATGQQTAEPSLMYGGSIMLIIITLVFFLTALHNIRLRRRYIEQAERLARSNQRLAEEVSVRQDAEKRLRETLGEIEARVRARSEDLFETKGRLEHTNSLLSAALDAMRSGILVVQDDTEQVVMNDALKQMLGLPADSGVPFDSSLCFHWLADRVRDPDALARSLDYFSRHPNSTSEERIHLRDGRVFTRLTQPFKVGREVLGRVWVFRDITEQETMQQRLHQTIRELGDFKRALDEHALVSITNIDGRITYANEHFCAVSGYSLSELLGKNHSIVNSGTHPKEFYKTLWDTVLSGRTWRGEFCNQGKSGRRYWVESTIVPFLDERGSPQQFLAVHTEITMRKRVEQELRASEARYLALASNVPGVIFQWYKRENGDDGLYYISPRLESTFGIKVDDAMTNWRKAFHLHDDDRAAFDKSIRDAVKHENEWAFEGRLYGKDGRMRWFRGQSQPMRNRDDEVVFNGILFDITERQQFERELMVAKDAAEAAAHAKSEFLANMSHEIRTPMNAILGFAELVAAEATDERQREYLSVILSSGQNLLALINDLLDFSRMEAGKLRLQYDPMNLYAFLRDIEFTFIQKTERKGLFFEIDIAENIPASIIFDEVRLRQVLFNLIDNAIKFTEHGGVRLKLSSARHREETQTCDLIIQVEDTGMGIEEKQMEIIFEAFEQAGGQSIKKYGGTGLGLAITRRLVEMLDGEIDVESQPGRGACFRVAFKGIRITSAQLKPQENLSLEEERKFAPATVLVVDDNDSNRAVLRRIMERYDLHVREAEDGASAIKSVQETPPDLILLDMLMPGMNGQQVVKMLRASEESRHIPVVFVTAVAEERARQLTEQTGANGLLLKPVDRQLLIEELRKHLRSQPAAKTVPPFKNNDTKPESPLTSIEESEELTDAQLARLRELLKQLNSTFKRDWERLNRRMNIHEVQQFASALLQRGKDFERADLEAFSRTLKTKADVFDIAGVRTTLSQYPDLVSKLNTKLKKHIN